MKISSRKFIVALASLVAAQAGFLVACAGGGQTDLTPSSRSGVSPDTPHKFLYVSNWPNSVWSYDWPTGNYRFTLAGATFNEPYGQCVDAAGNVFITNYGVAGAGHGKTYRYHHNGFGGPTHTYGNGTAAAIGCSVFGTAPGDLAVTYYSTAVNTGAGEVRIWSGEVGPPTTYAGQPTACYNLWPGGFDNAGNLFVEGEPAGGGTVSVCELTASPRAWVSTPLTFGSGINAPGSAMWDGQYLTLTDTMVGGANFTGIYQVTLSGTTLTLHGVLALTDGCTSTYVDTVQPFILGHHNTPANNAQGTLVVGGLLSCTQAGAPEFYYWKYPAGGSPTGALSNPPPSPYGQSISLP